MVSERFIKGLFLLVAFGVCCGVLGAEEKVVSSHDHNYEGALAKAILFFEGQRSGKLPKGQRVKWRGDSALSNGRLDHVNLKGGYYDAGNNVKFGWPMGFSISLLSWVAREYKAETSSANQLGYLREAI
ncbi:hypothetical protein Droror1_Dr00025349 [Drosera rotundifolia]